MNSLIFVISFIGFVITFCYLVICFVEWVYKMWTDWN